MGLRYVHRMRKCVAIEMPRVNPGDPNPVAFLNACCPNVTHEQPGWASDRAPWADPVAPACAGATAVGSRPCGHGEGARHDKTIKNRRVARKAGH